MPVFTGLMSELLIDPLLTWSIGWLVNSEVHAQITVRDDSLTFTYVLFFLFLAFSLYKIFFSIAH